MLDTFMWSTTYNLDRQAIINRVYTHFIIDKQPAGRADGHYCTYHGCDDDGHTVACAIGMFDDDNLLTGKLRQLSVVDVHDLRPHVLPLIFGQPTLTDDDITFLCGVRPYMTKRLRPHWPGIPTRC